MGVEGRLRRLELSFGDEAGPSPQEFYDARARRTRYVKTLMASAVGHEVSEDDLDFAEHYRDSALKESDGELLERYTPPRSPEDTGEARARLKASLGALAERRRADGI
jgi:hypothetical protein